jgi:hypothetical protein
MASELGGLTESGSPSRFVQGDDYLSRLTSRCLFYALGAWPLKADVFGGENARNTVDMTLGNIRLPGRSPSSARMARRTETSLV